MAAPGCHVGLPARREAAVAVVAGGIEADSETEEEAEAEEPGPAALRSVFPRDPELFADAFPVERRYRLCGRVLRIAQHHGPRLGLAASVWEAALFLCRYIEEQRLDFRGRRVIELGAGTGIVGILVALLGGDVTITDQPAALDQIRENVRLNFPEGGARPRVQALVWGQDEEGSVPGGYEVILGSDIVYHPPSFGPLLDTLRRLCGPPAIALLCTKMRGGDGGARLFFHQMLPPYFRVQLLRREPEEEIEIYRVSCRSGGDPVDGGEPIGGGGPVGGGEPKDGGEPMDGGDPVDGGEPKDGRDPVDGGEPKGGGEPMDGADPLDGGEPKDGGDPVDGGEPKGGGEPMDGGDPVDGGEPTGGGNPVDGGEPKDGGEPMDGREPIGGGDSVDGEEPKDGGEPMDGGDPIGEMGGTPDLSVPRVGVT